MKVVLTSLFRNAADRLPAYFARVDALAAALAARGDQLALVLSAGDSVDGTVDALAIHCAGLDATVVRHDHGGPVFGSTTDARRLRQLAGAGNAALARLPADTDAWLYAEADLVWRADDALRLLQDLEAFPAVAPLVLGHDGTFFYDTWAFRKDGQHFRSHAPYHPALRAGPRALLRDLVLIDTAGSLLALRGRVARVCRFSAEEAIVGLCRALGGLHLDPTVAVYHPCLA